MANSYASLAKRRNLLVCNSSTNVMIPFTGVSSAAASIAPVDEKTLNLIRALRELWRKTQLSGRGDFDRACLLISGDESITVDRYASAFFQGAQIFAHRHMKFFTEKARSVSDDEMWLARLLQALNTENYANARYLMALRITSEGRRRLMFLAQGLATTLCADSQ